ncbi:signal peptidase I [Desertimonas flava]|uniref:signal peptidase I n=1 Tax=Desertimonas flava TaxID=2064846 RepID=UPI000E34CDCA|nr:signal peptidase I [Desertimonas flava]
MTDPFEPPQPPAAGADPTSAYPLELADAEAAPTVIDEDGGEFDDEETEAAAASRRRKRRARGLIDWIVVVGIALIVAFVVRTYVLAHFVVDGHSMDYTLHDGDRVFVNKLSYRLHDPRRGDVVVLHQRAVNGEGTNRDLIKRVIALPGETIAMRNCVVTIDGVVLEEPYLDDTVVTPGNCGPEIAPTLVEDGHVFVMGDNRPESQDSRALGAIDEDDLVGRAFVVFWPTSNWRWL